MRPIRTIVCAIAVTGVFLTCASRPSRAADIPELQANSGPFLVMVNVFRGEACEVNARVLASELTDRDGLTTYLLPASRMPGRKYDRWEVVVFVGDAETADQARKLRTAVVKSPVGVGLKPVVTFNPLAPAGRSQVARPSQ